jgi:EF-hand domain-containing protein 1
MASNFPKLPGFVPTHDPTLVDHKRVSHKKLEQLRNGKNVAVPLYTLPRAATMGASTGMGGKPEEHKSLSQTQYLNPFGTGDIAEQFEPNWVKLDKQVRILH